MSGVSKSRLTVLLYLIVITAFFIPMTPAFAQVNFTDNEAAFLSAYPGLSFQNFESSKVPPVDALGCPSPADALSDNECFSTGDILPGIAFFNGPVSDPVAGLFLVGTGFTAPGAPSGPALTAGINDDFEILLDPGVSKVGLTLGCIVKGPCDRDVEVLVFNANHFFLDSITVHVTSDFNTFLGISSNTLIGNISLRNPDSENTSFKGVQNIWFGNSERSVPTLSEWGMIAAAAGLMIVGVYFAASRRRRNAV